MIGRAGALTIKSQAAALSLNHSLDSEAAAAGSGWALSGHGLVSADWLAGPCCKIPAPGRQMETNTAAAAVRLRGESKAALYNDITKKLDCDPVGLTYPT